MCSRVGEKKGAKYFAQLPKTAACARRQAAPVTPSRGAEYTVKLEITT